MVAPIASTVSMARRARIVEDHGEAVRERTDQLAASASSRVAKIRHRATLPARRS